MQTVCRLIKLSLFICPIFNIFFFAHMSAFLWLMSGKYAFAFDGYKRVESIGVPIEAGQTLMVPAV